jgi:ATP:cob(I)alamin adenosyltransferase
MGHRLSRIYTRTGDDGSTGLGNGRRTGKDAPRVEAYGSVDETNATLGLLLALPTLPADVRALLQQLQHRCFDLGAELCIPGHAVITEADVEALEQALDRYNADLPPLKDFILPGGSEAAARCHLARTVARRAERDLVALARCEPVRPQALAWLNRLSDLLFVLARVLARVDGGSEVLWQPASAGRARRP